MEINIGDKVYVGVFESQAKERPCPVCFTEKVVTLILGDGTHVELECDYCRRGWETPSGYIQGRYYMEPYTRKVTVEEIRIESDGTSIVAQCRIYHLDKHIGATREEALEKAKAQCENANAERKAKEERLDEKAKKHKSYSWNAGYYMRKAESSQRDVDRCRAKAKVMKSKAR